MNKNNNDPWPWGWLQNVGDYPSAPDEMNESEPVWKKPECECGQKGVEWAKHSDWCPLFKDEREER